MSLRFRSNWNLKMLVFVEERKPENPEKNRWSKDENQQRTQPTRMMTSPGIEPEPHWWEASALTTAPSLLPNIKRKYQRCFYMFVLPHFSCCKFLNVVKSRNIENGAYIAFNVSGRLIYYNRSGRSFFCNIEPVRSKKP